MEYNIRVQRQLSIGALNKKKIQEEMKEAEKVFNLMH